MEVSKKHYENMCITSDTNKKYNNLESWANEVRKLREIDKRPENEIKAVIEFIYLDSFWQENAVSLASIRKKSNNGLTKYDNILKAYNRATNNHKIDYSFLDEED